MLDLQPEVVAELREAGVSKFQMEIVIDTGKNNHCRHEVADIKVVRDTLPNSLNCFLTPSQQALFNRALLPHFTNFREKPNEHLKKCIVSSNAKTEQKQESPTV